MNARLLVEPRLVERLFYPCATGFVFAATGLSVRLQLPFYGMVVLSLGTEPVRIRLGDTLVEHRAMAIWCKDVRFEVPATPFVCVAVNSLHPDFRAFVKIGKTDVVPLERDHYGAFDNLMNAAGYSRRFVHDEALELFEGVMTLARRDLPPAPKLDERAKQLMLRVCRQPRVTLPELAAELGLSYHRTSHLFAQAVGLPARTYQLWQKLYRAGVPLMRGASLTEVAHAAGFVDSAHYSNAFQTAYGRSPTDMLKIRRVIVFYRDAFSDASIRESIREGLAADSLPARTDDAARAVG